MFVVRETFTARPGQASKLAAMLKDAVATRPSLKTRVLTDFIAGFNTVVLETETEDLSAVRGRDEGVRHQQRDAREDARLHRALAVGPARGLPRGLTGDGADRLGGEHAPALAVGVERVAAAVVEEETGAGDQILHRARDQHLAVAAPGG